MTENYIVIDNKKTILTIEQVEAIRKVLHMNIHNEKQIKKKHRPSSISKEKEYEVCNLLGTCHIQDIVNTTGLTRNQIYGIKNKYKDELTSQQLKRFAPEAIGRLGEVNYNNKGTLMKIIEYQNANNVIVEFQDDWKAKVHTRYQCFKVGGVYNPYDKNVCGVGITGDIYPSTNTKEYSTWQGILHRSFDEEVKNEHFTYQDVTCCKDWLYYPNFYEWLHNQPNFDQWLTGERWAIDKDILVKGNKIYSPDTCCLVPQRVNQLFALPTKNSEYLLGVQKSYNKFIAEICKNDGSESRYIGTYNTEQEAFEAYKQYKEKIIKKVATEEFAKSNITKKCYDAMMSYEITI